MISLIDRWYANLQALEVDGNFFEEIEVEKAVKKLPLLQKAFDFWQQQVNKLTEQKN